MKAKQGLEQIALMYRGLSKTSLWPGIWGSLDRFPVRDVVLLHSGSEFSSNHRQNKNSQLCSTSTVNGVLLKLRILSRSSLVSNAAVARTLWELLQAVCSVARSRDNSVLTESSRPVASGGKRRVEPEGSASCSCLAREWPARAVT